MTKEKELLVDEQDVNTEVVSVNMKRYLKKPEDVAAMKYADYVKILKRVTNSTMLQHAPFVYITSFDFAEGESGPFIFIGQLPALWKKMILSRYKMSNDFARGTCSVNNEDGKRYLDFEILGGKGGKERNLRKINKDLLRRMKMTARFASEEGTDTTRSEEKLQGSVQSKVDGIEKSEEQVKKGLIAQSHTIVGRIEQEMINLRALPKGDHAVLIEKAKQIQALIQEWSVHYKRNQSEREPEKAYVKKVEDQLNANIFNSSAFKTLEIKEFADDWKEYTKQWVFIKQMLQEALKEPNMEARVVQQQEAYEEAQELYENLRFFQIQIRTWKAENSKHSGNHSSFFEDLSKRILARVAEIDKIMPGIGEDDENRSDIAEIEKRWQDLQAGNTVFLAWVKSKDAQLQEKASLLRIQKHYTELLNLHGDCENWLLMHDGLSDKKKKSVISIRDGAQKVKTKLRDAGVIAERFAFDNPELLAFNTRYHKLSKQSGELGTALTNALGKQIAKPTKEVGTDGYEDELEKLARLKEEGLAEYEEKKKDVLAACAAVNDLRSDIRAWSKLHGLSSNDTARRDELYDKLQTLYKNFSALLTAEDKEMLYAKQGFNPEALEELGERTKLPKIPKASTLSSSSAYQTLVKDFKAYEKIPATELESRRLALLRLTETLSRTDFKKSEKKALQELEAVIYSHLKEMSVFSTQRDNFMEIMDLHRSFETQTLTPQKLLKSEDASKEVEDLIKDIDDEISDWQSRHTNLSGFGTRAQNKSLENIRRDMDAFVQEFARIRTGKKGVELAKDIFDTGVEQEAKIKLLAALALRTAQKGKDRDIEGKAKEIAQGLAAQEGLSTENKGKLLKLVEDQALKASKFFDTLSDEEKIALENFTTELDEYIDESPIQHDSINDALVSKEAYSIKKDKTYSQLLKLIGQIEKLNPKLDGKKLIGASNKSKFQTAMSRFGLKYKLWSAVMEAKERNEDWFTAMAKINDFVSQDGYIKAQAVVEGIDGKKEQKALIKQNISISKDVAKGVDKLEKKREELYRKYGRNKKSLKEIVETREKLFAARNLLISKANELEEDYLKYKENYDKLSPELQKAYEKELEKYKKLAEDKNNEVRAAFEDKTGNRLADKTLIFNNFKTFFERYLAKDSGDRKLEDVENLETLILDWNEILIMTKDENVFKTLKAQTDEVEYMRDILRYEKAKFEDGKVKEIPDAFYEQILSQFDALDLKIEDDSLESAVPEEQLLPRISYLLTSIDTWKNSHPVNRIENVSRAKRIEELETTLSKALGHSSVSDQATALQWTQKSNALRKYALDFQTREGLNDDQKAYCETWAAELDTRIKQQTPLVTSKNINTVCQELETWNNEQEWGFWELDFQAHRKEEQRILAVFDGHDVFSDLSNISSIVTDEEKEEIRATIDKAVERARKAIELEQYDKAEKILSHIPPAFWPDDVFEDMRLWQKIQKQFLPPSLDELDKFSPDDVQNFVERSISMNNDRSLSDGFAEPLAIKENISEFLNIDDIKDELKGLKDKDVQKGIEIIKAEAGKIKELAQAAVAQGITDLGRVSDFILQELQKELGEDKELSLPKQLLSHTLKEFENYQVQQKLSELLSSSQSGDSDADSILEQLSGFAKGAKDWVDGAKETVKPVTDALSDVKKYGGFGLGIATDLAGSVSEVLGIVNQWKETKKMDKYSPERKKAILQATLQTTAIGLKQVNKLSKIGTKSIETFVPKGADDALPPQAKIAKAVFAGITLFLETAIKVTEKGAENPSLKDIMADVKFTEAVDTVSETVITLGAGVSSIVEIFLPAASVVTACFALAGNVRDLAKSAVALHNAKKIAKQTKGVLTRAVQQDSVMLPAMRRQMKTAKQDVTKKSIDVAGDSIKVLGSVTSTAGAFVSLAPAAEAQAAAVGLKIAGTIVQQVGTGIKIAGKLVFTGIDQAEKAKTKKLLEEAKYNRNVRAEVLSNSKAYAKMALAIGVLEEDPIAVEYCVMRGFTEDDLNESNAGVILSKLLQLDEESLDEATIIDKAKQSITGAIKSLSDLAHIASKYKVESNTVLELRQTMTLIDKRMALTKKALTALTVGTVLGAIVSPFTLIASIPALDKTKTELKAKLLAVETSFGEAIDNSYERIDELSLEISTGNSELLRNWSMEAANALLEREARIKDQRILIEELRKSRAQIKQYGEQIKKTVKATN